MSAKVAIVGSGNIGTDLAIKIAGGSGSLEVAWLVGIDPESDGLARARKMGIATTHKGVADLAKAPDFDEIRVILDATSARAHQANYDLLEPLGKPVVDLTPAAIGPFVVPVVNLDEHRRAPNLNMVTCGGQATIPIVAAVARVAPVRYAEIVASIASRSAGPGTRANIDEFTRTTARGLEVVGGAERGKAIIVLNPAEPPLMMRDTVFCLSAMAEEEEVRESIERMVAAVGEYVPGYRLKQEVQFEPFRDQDGAEGLKTSVFLEVEGAGDYLPKYAGNLDIMTSAAVAVAERLAGRENGGTP